MVGLTEWLKVVEHLPSKPQGPEFNTEYHQKHNKKQTQKPTNQKSAKTPWSAVMKFGRA
jgi:hypothetical protein